MDRIHISAAQSAIEVPNASPGHILLIAQDVAVAKGVCADLDAAGLRCTFVHSRARAQQFVIQHGVDLILLDRVVLATAGACWRKLRGHEGIRNVPILTFDRRDHAPHVATKAETFLNAIVRPAPRLVESHGIVLEPITQRVSFEGQDIRLPLASFRLLEYLLKNPGRVLSRDELFANLWGLQGAVGRRIDVYVGKLRKLLQSQNGGTLIQTVRGAGYIFAYQRRKGRRLPLRCADGREHPTVALRPQEDQFKLDHEARCLQIQGVGFRLSPREFAVLELLMLNPELTLSRSVIAGCIWGQGNVDLRTVDATISRLRKAIDQRPATNRPICSILGRGYQFRA